jgi:MtrB/PioB family decaheme-associated outer membrane protein
MRTTGTVRLILAVSWVLAVAAPATAQTQVGGFGIEGNVEGGWRFFVDEPAKSRRAKWEEYRDYPGSALLEDLQLRIFRPDQSYSTSIGGSKWGQDDQEFSLRSGRLGLWEFGFDWDQIPHVFSTNARFLPTETSRGVFTLPTTRPALVLYNSAPDREISERWDTARIFLKLTPTPDLELKAEYTRIRKDGDRPFGMAMGSPGSNHFEILEPIEQTIHDFRIKGTWAKENWQLQFGYTLSIFQNDLDAVRADNPCFGAVAPAGCGAAVAGAPATGQTSLAPNNMAHAFTLGGGVNLPLRTRVNANFSYSLMLQNEDFLPHTINPLLTSNKDLVLPQNSLNGRVQTYLLNLSATSRPITPLTLSLKYRLFALDDSSDAITFPGVVVNDLSVSPSRQAHRHEYLRQGAGVDGRWQLPPPLPVSLTLGTAWDQWRRNEVSEATITNEYSGKVALDATPWDWLLVRTSYIPSWRRLNNYVTEAHEAHTVFEDPSLPPATTGQSLLLRKFYEADFNKNKAELMVQIMPVDTLTITPTLSYSNTDYIDSPLGMQQTDGWSAGVDVSWAPFERVSLSVGYMHEVNFNKMRSRSRTATGSTAVDFVDYDWISDMTDTFDTIYAGVKATIIPGVLDVRFNGSYAYALGRVENRNPTAPVSGTDAQDFSAKAKPMPAFEDELLRLETALTYHFLKNWSAKFSYVFESFTKHDWRTDNLNPFSPSAGNSIWQGNDLRNYTAHILTATLGYRFK